ENLQGKHRNSLYGFELRPRSHIREANWRIPRGLPLESRNFPRIKSPMVTLVHDLIHASVRKYPGRTALISGTQEVTYSDLWTAIESFSKTVLADAIGRHDRLAIYTEKRIENVVAMFGASHAGAVFVPVNPALKAAQVSHILRD